MHADQEHMRTIVVGVDGSPASLSALRWAEALAYTDTTIRAVRSWAAPLTVASSSVSLAELEADATRQLDHALAQVPAGSLPRTTAIVRDISAAAALLDESRDADLLVTGTRGLNKLERLLLGSVAVQCAQHASCPFIAVPQLSDLPGVRITVGYDNSDAAQAAQGGGELALAAG
ncbi:MAG: universal stress protein, partial [Acidimicrobiales bacterium]